MIEESLGIFHIDHILPLTEEQQQEFSKWDWINPDTSLVWFLVTLDA